MLLDSHLVEKFHALHRQKLSGVLRATGDDFAMGICLSEGEPVAVDLGVDLERAFADACRTYHKLDDAALAELDAAIAGGAKGREYLVERQLISEAEGDQLAQAVVEDFLTRAFRGPCTGLGFDEGVGPDALPIGASAIKMRIGVEPLIRTCDQRVGEQLAVEQEVGSWDVVFALTEGEHVSGQLSEYEKMVLNFIDGRATIEQIAELCRDSSLNLARVMRSLLAKRIIHRLDAQRASGLRPAVAPPPASVARTTANLPGQPPAGGVATATEMTVYHAPRRETGSRTIVLGGLIALLAISLAVAVLVVQYNRKQETLRRDESEISQALSARQWLDARQTIARLRADAGNDLGAIRTVDALGAQVEAAIAAEITTIRGLIDSDEFAAARTRIGALPDDAGLTALLAEAEADQRDYAVALATEVRSRLATGDVGGALAAIDGAEAGRGTDAAIVLAGWRNDALALARSSSQPLHARLAALARLRQSRPDAALAAQLASLEAELDTRVRELSGRLSQLEVAAGNGAWREVQAELARLSLGELGVGTEIETVAARVASVMERTAADVGGATDHALAVLGSASDADALEAARARLAAALGRYPQASDRDQLERIAGALAASAGAGARTTAERAAEATALAAQVPVGEPRLAAALNARAAAMQGIEAQARLSLDEARRLGRIGDWDGAVAALEAIVRQPGWQLTAVRQEAELELDAARASAARRVQLRNELRAALLRGDLAACEAIAREIGLAYLPVVVSSMPDGAEVVDAEGKVLGTTPLIHDVTADERVDLVVTVRKPGYQQATLRGAEAEGGWRLTARLDRSTALVHAFPHPLTARPAVVGGRLWLGDRGRAVVLDRPEVAAIRTIPADAAAPLSEPVFAPVADAGGELLLGTREGLALRLGDTASRLPLPAPTDLAVSAYRSPLVIDRDLLIVAATDGRLLAVQRGTARVAWQTPTGARFAASPLLVEDMVLTVRSDGRLARIRAEDGQVEASAALDQPVLSAWATPQGLAGLTASRAWTWDGTSLGGEDLPEPSIGGGPGVTVGTFGKVMLRGSEAWQEVGRLDPRPAATDVVTALAWSGHAVVAHGRNLSVLGAAPFRLDAGSALLRPTVWGDLLVAASLEGGLWMWKP